MIRHLEVVRGGWTNLFFMHTKQSIYIHNILIMKQKIREKDIYIYIEREREGGEKIYHQSFFRFKFADLDLSIIPVFAVEPKLTYFWLIPTNDLKLINR